MVNTKKATSLCYFYLISTGLFYVFLPLMIVTPLFSFVGFHANLFILYMFLLLPEYPGIVLTSTHGSILLAVEIAFLLLLIAFSFLAIKKKWYVPFGVLTIVSNIITMCTLFVSYNVNTFELNLYFVVVMASSILGNLVYSIIYFRSVKGVTPQI